MTSSILPMCLHFTSLKISSWTEWCFDRTVPHVYSKLLQNVQEKSPGLSEGNALKVTCCILYPWMLTAIPPLEWHNHHFLCFLKSWCICFWMQAIAHFSFGFRYSIKIESLKSCLIWGSMKIPSLILASLRRRNLFF